MATRQEIAAAFARNADTAGTQGLGSAQSIYNFQVTGQAVLPSEQAAFFNVIPDTLISSSHAAATVVQTPSTGWSLTQLADYFRTHPAPAVNMNIPNSNNASLIAGMSLYTVRRTPDGKIMQSDIQLSTFQNAQDFQNTRVQVSLGGDVQLDGVTYYRLAWTGTAAPVASFLVAWSCGKAFDMRDLATPAAPMRVGG